MSAVTAVAAVVVRDDRGRVLLVKENYGRRQWGLPGGAVEAHEMPTDAAVREAREETGAHVELDYLIGLYTVGTAPPSLRFMFAAHVVEGVTQPRSSAEIADIAWFPPDELPSDLWPSAAAAIRDATAGVRGCLRDITV